MTESSPAGPQHLLCDESGHGPGWHRAKGLPSRRYHCMCHALVCFSDGLIKRRPKATWKGRGLCGLHRLRSIAEGNQGGNSSGRNRNTASWLASSALSNYLSYAPQDHLPKTGDTHSWAGPSCTGHQSRKGLTDMATGHSDQGNSSTEVPSSRVTLHLCPVDTMTTGLATEQLGDLRWLLSPPEPELSVMPPLYRILMRSRDDICGQYMAL